MRPLERFLLGVLMAAAAFGEGVGSSPRPVVEPVGDVRELSRFSFRVTTPAVSATQDPDGWSDLTIEGFGTSERRPGAPNLPSRTFLVAIPDGAMPRLEVEPLGVRLLAGKRPRPVARVDASVEPEDERGRRRISRQRTFQAEDALYAAPEAAVRLGQIGILREQRYVEVIVTPARYRADRGGIEIWDRFQVTVAFEGAATTAAQPSPDARYEDVYRKAFVNYAQGLLFRLPSKEATAEATNFASQVAPAAALGSPRYEIKVRQTGVVRLDSARLTGTGFPAEPISTWRLRSRGVEVPLQVNDDGDGVLEAGEWVQFWGQALDEEPKTVLDTDVPGNVDLWAYNDATDENVYLLTAEPGAHARMTARASAPTFTRTPPTDFEAVAHREVDDAWRPLGSADPWDWSPTLQTGTATVLRTDDVALPGLVNASGPVDVSIQMKATSEDGTVVPDHRTRLTLLNSGNTVLVQQDDDGTFDGRVIYEQSLGWAGGQVTNPMRVRTEARPISVGNHSVMLNWIEVRYRRAFTAASDGLVFTWPNQDAEFVVGNLLSSGSSLVVYEVTGTANAIAQPVQLTGVSVSGAGPFSVRFRVDKNLGLPDGAPRTFAVAGNGAAAVPAGADFAADTVSDLRDNATQADLLVIAHPALLDQAAGSPLTQLLALRASRGLSSKVARLDDIQDEFNDGIAGPAAIRNFLRWVMSTAPGEGWASPKPAYVLLLGDGSYDYKGGTVNGNYVPTQIIFKDDPALGYYASDNVLASVVGSDALPDLAVGRLPARSLVEANALLQKVLDYEQAAPAGTWRNHALFISDRGKPITNTNEALAFEHTNALSQGEMKIPPHTARQLRYFTDYGGTNSALIRNDIKKGINGTLDAGVDGAAVVQFIGHGNFDLWSDDIIFDKNDAAALNNGGRLPWLLAHNCLTSGFHSTAATTIGEAFMKRVGGGAIAVFSPSGLSFSYFGDIIAHTVFHDLYGPPKEREIATPVMDSLVALLANQSVEALEGYVLLGDPALRLALPTLQPPGIPTATASNRRVDLSWTPSGSAGATYDVWRTADLVADPYEKVNGAPLAGTSFADTTPSNGTTYYYYVVARDGPGFESRWSNFNSDCLVSGPDCVDARPLNPNPPATPAGVSLVDPESGGRLNLSWLPISDPNNELVRYDVCWGTVSGSYACASAAKTTSFVLTNLTNGQRYYVVVRAINTSSLTSQSGELSAVPTFVRGVKSPGFISSLRVSRSGNDLVLTWTPVTADIYGKPTGPVTYQVFRGTTAGFDPSLGAPLATNLSGATFTDSGAAVTGPAYYYLVRARDAQGNVGGLGLQLPNGIDTLTLSKSTVNPGRIILSWPAVTTDFDGRPSRIREYRIYAAATPFTRADIRNGTVGPPLTTTTGTQVELTPPAGGQDYSVLVVDERGNLSSF